MSYHESLRNLGRNRRRRRIAHQSWGVPKRPYTQEDLRAGYVPNWGEIAGAALAKYAAGLSRSDRRAIVFLAVLVGVAVAIASVNGWGNPHR